MPASRCDPAARVVLFIMQNRGTLLAIAVASVGWHLFLSKAFAAAHEHLSNLAEEQASLTKDVFDSLATLLLGYSLAQTVSSAAGVFGLLRVGLCPQ
jgi:hypothetical protein